MPDVNLVNNLGTLENLVSELAPAMKAPKLNHFQDSNFGGKSMFAPYPRPQMQFSSLNTEANPSLVAAKHSLKLK